MNGHIVISQHKWAVTTRILGFGAIDLGQFTTKYVYYKAPKLREVLSICRSVHRLAVHCTRHWPFSLPVQGPGLDLSPPRHFKTCSTWTLLSRDLISEMFKLVNSDLTVQEPTPGHVQAISL